MYVCPVITSASDTRPLNQYCSYFYRLYGEYCSRTKYQLDPDWPSPDHFHKKVARAITVYNMMFRYRSIRKCVYSKQGLDLAQVNLVAFFKSMLLQLLTVCSYIRGSFIKISYLHCEPVANHIKTRPKYRCDSKRSYKSGACLLKVILN